MLLAQQETGHGNPTFEEFDPSFLYSAFPSTKLYYYVCDDLNGVREMVTMVANGKLEIAFLTLQMGSPVTLLFVNRRLDFF